MWLSEMMCLSIVWHITLLILLSSSPFSTASDTLGPFQVEFSVFEEQHAGAFVGKLNPLPQNASPPYVIYFANENDAGDLDVSSYGVISVKRRLDREVRSSYQFVAESSRGIHIQVTVHVQDINDNSPVFNPSNVTLRLQEAFQVGVPFFATSAEDIDLGNHGVQHYDIIEGARDLFFLRSFNSPRGHLMFELSLSHSLDFEATSSYDIVVRAYDGGVPSRFGDLSINILVDDVNDNMPVMTQTHYSATVPETASEGTAMLQINATDLDSGQNGQVEFFIEFLDNINTNFFAINRTTGLVYVNAALDFNVRSLYSLLVTARDGGNPPLHTTATVDIWIHQAGHNPLAILVRFLTDDGSNRLGKWIRPQDLVAEVTVVDSNRSVSVDSAINLVLSDHLGYFVLEKPSQDQFRYFIALAKHPSVDKHLLHHLMLTASRLGLSVVKNLTVLLEPDMLLEEQSLRLTQAVYFSEVPETILPGTSVSKIQASDGRKVTFRINPWNSSALFRIDPDTGSISTNSVLGCGASRSYTMQVTGVDSRGSTASAVVVVNATEVKGHAPKFQQHFYRVFVENLAAGACIKKVSASDPDCASERIQYSLLPVSTGRSVIFEVNSVTGELCVTGGDVTRQRSSRQVEHLTVVATDEDGLSATTLVQVLFMPSNVHRPVFISLNYSVTISRREPLEGDIVAVMATDADSGVYGTVRYQIMKGTSSSLFRINPETGTIRCSGMSLPQRGVYHLSVVAVDGGNLTSPHSAGVTVTILDSSSSLPLPFSRHVFSFTVSEDAPPGFLVGTLAASHIKIPDDLLSYSLLESPFSRLFQINEKTGWISTNAPLDRELQSSMLITTKANYAGLDTFAQVRVTIVDVNDNSPEFFTDQIQVVVREDILPGTLVYTALAKDRDSLENGPVHYRLTDGDDLFSVNRQLGEIKLKRSLNAEIQTLHMLRLVAVDSGTPPRSTALNVFVIVLDVNDNGPSFLAVNFTFAVDELLPVGSVVGMVNAVDVDSGNNGRVTYHLNTNVDAFGVDRHSGVIWTKSVLDHEEIEEYLLSVTATDGGLPAKSTSALVQVIVNDVNEFEPEFVEDSYTFLVEENHRPPHAVGSISAIDLDRSSYLIYSIVPPSSSFAISSDTGKLTTAKTLDREEIRVHVLTVQVLDRGSKDQSATTTVTVLVTDVNDNSPKFIPKAMEPVHVDVNLPAGSQIARVFAVDSDDGENQTVTYHFHSDHHGRNLPHFLIDSHSGIVTSKTSAKEMKSEYMLKIIAQDSGVQPRKAPISLKVYTDSLPNRILLDSSENSFTFAVEEDAPVGSVVGLLVNNRNRMKRNETTDFFVIQGNQFGTFGVISSTARLYLTRSIDYESVPFYNLLIKAVSRTEGLLSRVLNVSISVVDINDNGPRFPQSHVITSVSENVPVGTAVFQAQASDDDSGRNGLVTYSILSQTPIGNWLSVDEASGMLRTNTKIDYEEVRRLVVVVMATDAAEEAWRRLSSTVQVTVVIQDVNDNAPVFDSSVVDVSVFEDSSVGHLVTTVVAVDDDGYENGRVTYRIVSGNVDGRFHLSPDTGALSVAQALDREIVESYHLMIGALDHGEPSFETTSPLTVHVADVNDNVPSFNQTLYNVTVLEESPVGTFILKLKATDLDDPETSNADLFFYFSDVSEENPFAIDSSNGNISLALPLDRESEDRWIFTVRVSNVGEGNLLYDSATVVINVLDINDNSPVFHELFYSLEISENANMAVIHTIEATDKDSGNNGRITYSIKDDMGGKFSIDRKTGKLSCLALDRELKPFYNLTVFATDNGEPETLSSSMQIMVRVLDDNDNDPIFHQDSYSVSIPEDIAEGTSILHLEASDADEGPNAEISFSLSNGASGLFVVDSVTGIVNASGEFDREKTASYSFEAFATDGGLYGPRSRAVRVDITIVDVNDNAPVFDRFPYRADIPLDFPVGQTVLTVSASDKDTDRNGQVFYSLTDNSQYFQLDPMSGQITTKRLLDISSVRVHTLRIKAQDRADRPKNSTGIVEIQVGNAKTTGALRFVNQTYSIHIPENMAPSTSVLSVQARFASGSSGPGILYSFANGNEDSTFGIHPDTGLITILDSTKLDFEVSPRLRLIVIATAGSAYDYTTIWINLKDVNDNAPRFSQHRYTSSVWECNLRGTFVTQVMATDADSGANSRITYSIVSGNIQNAFVIDPPNTGIVKTNDVLDRETRDFYRLEIEACDFGKPSLKSTVMLRIQVIDTNDNAPMFPVFAPVNIREGTQVGTMILQVSATDADLNPTLAYGFQYSGGVNEDAFSIDRYSGKIFIAKRLDHETCAVYQITVMVSDEVHNSSTHLLVNIIDDNDNGPVFDQTLYQVSVPELTGPDVYVTAVRGSDADNGENGRIEYSLLSVDGFYINATSGAIYTKQVVVFNKHQQHTDLVVTARDHGVPPLSANVVVRLKVIDINDHAPVFSMASYKASIKEDTIATTTIFQVVATDDDHLPENTRLRYTIFDGNDDHAFLIDETTGSITLNKTLDHEQRANYTLTVSVSDSGAPPLSSTALVHVTVQDVNDNAPQFSSSVYRIQVREDVPIDSNVLSVSAKDRDAGDNARVLYSIVSWSNGTFGIDRDSGAISVRAKLNFESKSFYWLNVSAGDCSLEGPRRTSFAQVLINVTDVNEHRPQFSSIIYVKSVIENQPNGSYVFTAQASDRDGGRYGVVRYRLVPEHSKDEGMLKIDPETGIVTTNGVLTYLLRNGVAERYQFKVLAEDAGGLNTSVDLYLSVEPEVMKPRFLNHSYRFVVPGSAQLGDTIGQVQAVDKDEKPSIHIIYFLQAESEFFAINHSNGMIYLLKSLQRASLGNSEQKALGPSSARSRREPAMESAQVVVIAQCGFPDTKKSTAVVEISVNRSCELCALVEASEATALTSTHLILLIVFLIVAVVMVTVIGGILIRSQRPKTCRDDRSHSESSSFETIDMPPPPLGNIHLPPPYMEVQSFLLHNTTSEMTNRSLSASSGRGSVNKGEDVDEEIQLINSEALSRGVEPDSGLLADEVVLVEPYRVAKYADAKGAGAAKRNKRSVRLGLGVNSTSVESMHHFSDEGGGEGDGLDIGQFVNDEMSAKEFTENGKSTYPSFLYRDDSNGHIVKQPSSHSTATSREEDLSSFDWDYFVNWKPEYSACVNVYKEIALLKDENLMPKIKRTQFVIQPPGVGFLPFSGRTRLFPPPIITDAPPRSVPVAHSNGRNSDTSMLTNSNTASSEQTSQLNSVSLPKSAMSYESTFTESPNLSLPFTPSLSPVGTCSPAVSTWNTPNGMEPSDLLLPDHHSLGRYMQGGEYGHVRTYSGSDLDELET